MLSYLLYTSVSNIKNHEELDKILLTAVNFNKNKNITGILLFDETNFLQILEGEKEDIENLFDNIKKDKRHTEVLLKIRGTISNRNCPNWSMRLSIASKKSILPIHNMSFSNNIKKDDDDTDILQILTALIGNTLSEYNLEHAGKYDLGVFSKLTTRELAVLKLLIKGNATKEIGTELNISYKTVSNHIDNIRIKLKCETSKDLIKTVFKSGYIMYLI